MKVRKRGRVLRLGWCFGAHVVYVSRIGVVGLKKWVLKDASVVDQSDGYIG